MTARPRRPGSATVLRNWVALPRRLRRAIDGLSPAQLGRRAGQKDWSPREWVHHIVEANLLATSMIIAALGMPGCVYDWTWLQPGGDWARRLGYGRVPADAALDCLDALVRHVARVVKAAPRGLMSPVRLKDETSGTIVRKTVRQLLQDECDHLRHHLPDIAASRDAAVASRRGGPRRPAHDLRSQSK